VQAIQENATADTLNRLEQTAFVTGKLSHDFGNYLTGIMGFTELGMLQLPPDSAANRYLGEVLQAAREAADWLRRLHLFCSRNSATYWPTHLPSVFAEEENRLRAAGLLQLRVEANIPVDSPLVALDLNSVHSIIGELAANAQEARKDGASLHVAARVVDLSETDCRTLLGAALPGTFVELDITDDGPGMPPEHYDKLFREIFFAAKPKHRGLGLLVVYGILRRCGGGMRLDAPSPGRGASVRLFLPVATVQPATHTGAANVLLALPDRHLAESMRTILQASGYRVFTAASPAEAASVGSVRGQTFALVVLDAQSPIMPGLDLARRILERDADARFVFLLTHPSLHGLGEEELLKDHLVYYWPMEPQAFVKAIEAAVARPPDRD
jgi:nitrogen-specific signal transduction histidine kinase/CheY-like chemotaxis protein